MLLRRMYVTKEVYVVRTCLAFSSLASLLEFLWQNWSRAESMPSTLSTQPDMSVGGGTLRSVQGVRWCG